VSTARGEPDFLSTENYQFVKAAGKNLAFAGGGDFGGRRF
jgi:hypothetical protein